MKQVFISSLPRTIQNHHDPKQSTCLFLVTVHSSIQTLPYTPPSMCPSKESDHLRSTHTPDLVYQVTGSQHPRDYFNNTSCSPLGWCLNECTAERKQMIIAHSGKHRRKLQAPPVCPGLHCSRLSWTVDKEGNLGDVRWLCYSSQTFQNVEFFAVIIGVHHPPNTLARFLVFQLAKCESI